jgi:hypothetical protein
MRQRTQTRWIADDDVQIMSMPPMGTRFFMDVNDEVLAKFGARALEHAIQRLGESIAYQHQPEIQTAVNAALYDHAWVRPIIEQEIRESVRDYIYGMLYGRDTR